MYFRMELHRPHFPLGRFDRSHRTQGAGHQVEAGGKLYCIVAMGHPDRKFSRESFEEAAAILYFNVGMTILALVRGTHLAA